MLARFQRDRIAWARHCFTILDKHGQLIPLTANAAQRRVYEAEQKQLRERGYVRTFVLKGRQGGVTTWEQASNVHQLWSEPGFNAMTLAHTDVDTSRIFGVTQLGMELFPRALLWPMGKKETREISFPTRRAKFWTGTAGAKRTGRSITLKRVHLSEFALYDEPVNTLNAIQPALVPNGSIVTLETTASGYDSDAHNFYRDAQQGANGYVPVFIPWWLCDQQNYRLPLMEPDELGALEQDEKHLVDVEGLTLEQIKWRRQIMREKGRGSFLQEYAEDEETCWAAAGGMFYDAELLKALMHKAPQPTDTEWGGALEVYGPHFGERVVIGCDTAEGVGGDRSAWVARTFPDRRLLAVFQDRAIEPKGLAGMLNTWGRRFASQGRPALLVPEKNAHGITVIRELRDTYQYPLSSIYERASQDTATKETKDKLGWYTSAESKPLLLDAGRILLNAARDGQATPPCLSAIRDAFAVRRDPKTGKVDTNGRDVWVSELLCEIGHQSVPARAFFIGRA
jgi:hypothetical protein